MSKYTLVAAGMVLATVTTSVASVPLYAQNTSSTSTSSSTNTVVTIPVTNVVRGAKDSVHVLATKAVANGEYTVKVVAKNQKSEHPGTSIIVSSSDDTVTVTGVEDKAFKEKTATGTLVVKNGKVTVSVKLGPDKVSSGGVEVVMTPVKKDVPKKEEPKKEEPKKVESVEDVKDVPAELPKTGSGSQVAALAAVTFSSYVATRLLRRQ